MFPRILCLAFWAALFVAGPGFAAEPRLPDLPGFAPRLTIYLAKGAPNACGPGCNHWIAVEGQIDAEAASRVRQFLRHVKDQTLPFYFNSPGGDLRQGLAIGRMLRSRHGVARVGRMQVTACGADPQIDDECEKIKATDKEIEATIVTGRAMCNSACGYLFLGATTREVAPDAVIGIHSGRLIMRFRGHPSRAMKAAATEINRDRADHEIAVYVAEMGIRHELVDLVHATPFEKPHLLTRQELYRFGIDKRDSSETAWAFELTTRPSIRKLVAIRNGDDGFRVEAWQFFCGGKDRVILTLIRETNADVKSLLIGLENDAGEIIPVTGVPRRGERYWSVNAIIKSADMSNLLDAGHLRISETAYSNDGHQQAGAFGLDMSSLDHVWAQFSLACATSSTIAAPTTVWPQNGTAVPVQTFPDSNH